MKINNENMYWLKKLSKRNDFENIHNKPELFTAVP